MIKNEKITLSMGAGGHLSQELMESVFLSIYGNKTLNNLDDSAEINVNGFSLAFTTDSFTIKPIFFPGGNIGRLSVCGTVNDLVSKGAIPVAISAGFIIEEGFPIENLKKIAQSIHDTTEEIGINVVTGDTKVVAKGEADGIFINTSGIGVILDGFNISCRHAKSGDNIIISGTIGDHGISILNAREGIEFSPQVTSDATPLLPVLKSISDLGKYIHVMRDPTRGGVASVLNEIANASKVNIRLFETELPLKQNVARCCDLLGMDPLYIANEGKLVLFVDPAGTEEVLSRIKSLPIGKDAKIIGKVDNVPYKDGFPPVYLETAIGTQRFIPMLEGEAMPRIC